LDQYAPFNYIDNPRDRGRPVDILDLKGQGKTIQASGMDINRDVVENHLYSFNPAKPKVYNLAILLFFLPFILLLISLFCEISLLNWFSRLGCALVLLPFRWNFYYKHREEIVGNMQKLITYTFNSMRTSILREVGSENKTYLDAMRQDEHAAVQFVLGIILILFFWVFLGAGLLSLFAGLIAPSASLKDIANFLSHPSFSPFQRWLLITVPFLAFLVGILVTVKGLHRRNLVSLITANSLN
jgi:hypothetical protein